MSKLTRESAKSSIRSKVTVASGYVHSLKHSDDIVDKLFDQHEAETVQLSMENDNLQKRIHELEELLKISRARNGRKTTEFQNLKEQLGGEVMAEFEGEAFKRGIFGVSIGDSDLYIDDALEAYLSEDQTYKVLVIKQKG